MEDATAAVSALSASSNIEDETENRDDDIGEVIDIELDDEPDKANLEGEQENEQR